MVVRLGHDALPIRKIFALSQAADFMTGNVRFTPESGHGLSASRCPLCAISGHQQPHSITSSDHIVGATE
jgi:hypothetical protein